MATFAINATARRTQFTSTGQTSYAFNFQVNATSEIQVFKNDTLQSLSTHYTITLASNGTGTVAFDSSHTPSSGDIITIIGSLALSRTTTFNSSSAITTTNLDTEFDNIIMRQQQLKEITDRSIQLKPSTPRTVTGTGTSGPLQFPYDGTASNNVNRIVKFDSNGTALELGSTTTNIDTLAAKATEIGRLGTSDAVADMALLGTSDVIADMALLATSSNIAAMALLGTSDAISDLNTLATSDIVSDLNTLATSDIVSDINTLATSDIVSDINTLATSDVVSDLNTLATSDIVSDINTLATSDIVSDLNTLATSDFVSDLNTLATSTNVTNIATVAGSISDLNSFASIYRTGSSDPSSSLDEGDLFYNSNSNLLKFYNGSAWVSISDASSLITVADESTDTSCNVLFTTGASGNLAPKSGTNLTFNSNTGLLTSTLLASTGLNVDGDATFTGDNYNVVWDKSANSLKFPDNAKAVFGAVPDLSIYHDGSNSVIAETGSGGLAILSSIVQIENAAANETMATFTQNGAVSLRHDNTEKFVTTADGVDITSTGSVKVPVGTTAQRNGAPATGDFRFNSTVATFEGYNGSAWGSVGGGATGAGGDTVFQENERVVTTNYTLSSNKSAMCVGPLTINTGVTVTIPSGERLVIL